MNLQTILDIFAGGKGSGCNPKVAQPKCGRPSKGDTRRTKFVVVVKDTKGKKHFLKKLKEKDLWIGRAIPLNSGEYDVSQVVRREKLLEQMKWAIRESSAEQLSKSKAEDLAKFIEDKGYKVSIEPIVEKPKVSREMKKILGPQKVQEDSKSILKNKAKKELKQKGQLVKMKDKGLKYTGTVATQRSIITQKTIKVKDDKGKTQRAVVTVVKPTGRNDSRYGTSRVLQNPNRTHPLNGKFQVISKPVYDKAEKRTTWIYDAESGKAPGAGTTVMVHQIKHTPTKSSILIHQLEREVHAQQWSQTEFKFKSGKPAQALLFKKYGIVQKWRK